MKERSRVRGRRVEEAEESGASRAGIEGKALPANGKKSSMSISHTLHAAHAALRWHNLPSPLPLYPLLTHTRHAAKIDLSQVCVVRSTCNLANLQLIIESHRNESRINSSWLCVPPRVASVLHVRLLHTPQQTAQCPVQCRQLFVCPPPPLVPASSPSPSSPSSPVCNFCSALIRFPTGNTCGGSDECCMEIGGRLPWLASLPLPDACCLPLLPQLVVVAAAAAAPFAICIITVVGL